MAWLLAPDRTIIGALMGTATTLEREVKLSFDSAEAAREAVLAAGATPLHGRRLQEDALLDTAGNTLRERGCALRIRMENGKSRITFKGPVQDSPMKLRDEFETIVGDGVLLLRIFEELGYQVWFRYEKYREEFAHEDVIVAVDETPVGRLRRDRRQRDAASPRWRRRWAARPPTTSSTRTAACSSSTARRSVSPAPTWCSTRRRR